MSLSLQQQSRFNWANNEIDRLDNEYKKMISVIKNYARSNGYSFDEENSQLAYNLLMRATFLREESKWNESSNLLSSVLSNADMLSVINKALGLNRSVNDYINNGYKLSSDLDALFDKLTKQSMYIFFYTLVLYRKIEHNNSNPFGEIDEILCALNYAYRGKDEAKTFCNNYIYDASSVASLISIDRYTFNNYYNWINSGFICDFEFHSGK